MIFNRFEKDNNDIFVTKGQEVLTRFSDTKHNRLFAIEDVSWWFQYRASLISAMAGKYFQKNFKTYDIGGGNGYTPSVMHNQGFDTAVIEPTYQACRHAKSRGIDTVICGTVDNSFPKDCFDQVLLLDVLEHIENDRDFLKMLHERMSSAGKILITVPAFMSLWSSQDVSAGHFRRYTRGQLVNVLTEAGFSVQYSSYFFSFLYIPILAVRVWGEKLGLLKPAPERSAEETEKIMKQQFERRKGLSDKLLSTFENMEFNRVVNGRMMPFGSSVMCIAEKR